MFSTFNAAFFSPGGPTDVLQRATDTLVRFPYLASYIDHLVVPCMLPDGTLDELVVMLRPVLRAATSLSRFTIMGFTTDDVVKVSNMWLREGDPTKVDEMTVSEVKPYNVTAHQKPLKLANVRKLASLHLSSFSRLWVSVKQPKPPLTTLALHCTSFVGLGELVDTVSPTLEHLHAIFMANDSDLKDLFAGGKRLYKAGHDPFLPPPKVQSFPELHYVQFHLEDLDKALVSRAPHLITSRAERGMPSATRAVSAAPLAPFIARSPKLDHLVITTNQTVVWDFEPLIDALPDQTPLYHVVWTGGASAFEVRTLARFVDAVGAKKSAQGLRQFLVNDDSQTCGLDPLAASLSSIGFGGSSSRRQGPGAAAQKVLDAALAKHTALGQPSPSHCLRH